VAPPYNLSGVHVMVVDDNEDTLYVVKLLLEYYGAVVTTSASVEDTRKLLRRVRPHVVVSDIGMPHNGLGVVHEVLATAQLRGTVIPAIAMTAFHGRRQELLAAGFVEVVEKPLDPRILCGSIVRHAQGARECRVDESSAGRTRHA
jgi:CheY-like chemotaxis protein